MKRLGLSFAFVVLGAWFVWSGEGRILDRLPEGGEFYLAYDPSAPGLSQTAVTSIFKSAEMKKFLAHLWKIIKEENIAKGKAPIPEGLFKNIFTSGLSVGVYLPAVIQPGVPPIPQVRVVVVPAEGTTDAFMAKINQLLTQGRLPRQERAIGQTTVTSLQVGFFQVEMAVKDGAVLFGISQGAIDPLVTGEFNPITRSPVYTELVSEDEKGSPVFEVVGSIELLLQKVQGNIPPQRQQVIQTLGLDSVRAFRVALTAEPPAMGLRGGVSSTGQWKGLLKAVEAFGGQVDTATALQMVPKDCATFQVGKLDWVKLYDPIITLARNIPGLGPRVEPFLRQLPVNLRDDILANLGDDFIVVLLRSVGSNAVFVCKLKNKERFLEAGSKLLDHALDKLSPALAKKGVRIEKMSRKERGLELSYIVFRGHPFPIAPAVATFGDTVVFALNPMDIKKYISALGTSPTILSNPDYRAVAAKLPEKYSMLAYAEQRETFENWYSLVEALVPFAYGGPKAPPSLDLSLLPSSSLWRRHLFGAVSTLNVSGDRVLFSSRGPLPCTIPPFCISTFTGIILRKTLEKLGPTRAPGEVPKGGVKPEGGGQ